MPYRPHERYLCTCVDHAHRARQTFPTIIKIEPRQAPSRASPPSLPQAGELGEARRRFQGLSVENCGLTTRDIWCVVERDGSLLRNDVKGSSGGGVISHLRQTKEDIGCSGAFSASSFVDGAFLHLCGNCTTVIPQHSAVSSASRPKMIRPGLEPETFSVLD